MSVTLIKTTKPSTIIADNMRDGDIGEVVSSPYSEHDGRVVMRNGSNLVTLGEPIGKSWTGFYNCTGVSQIRIRLLEKGEQITIT